MKKWRDERKVSNLLKLHLLVCITKDTHGRTKTDQELFLIRTKDACKNEYVIFLTPFLKSKQNE